MVLATSLDVETLPPPVRALCERLRGAGHGAWIVGGCVRDLLLGRSSGGDWDVATSARPSEVRRLFDRVVPTGIRHGTVTVLLEGGMRCEVTTLRAERGYRDGRRPDEVRFVNDIEEDLARRDFTINAIACDPATGRLIDPFDGRADLARRTLRAVGDPAARFAEDGLRPLRAARFVATLEMELDPATERAIAGSLDTFRKVSHERVRDEWLKALQADRPSRAFDVMQRTGLLGVSFPELAATSGCAQNRWHAYDVWRHTLVVLDAAPRDAVIRMAALLHDVGKPPTRAWSEARGDWTFHGHERVGAEIADAWLRDYRFSNDERERIVHLVRHHLIRYEPSWSDAAVRRFVARVGPDHVEPLLALARADVTARGRPVDDELRGLETLRARIAELGTRGLVARTADLAIDGRDVMEALGIGPGPTVGLVLRALLERVLEEPELNERQRLLALLPELDARLREGGS
ncbi:MAG: HD domain-containing protein [Myxococcota bacterium]|nr:HD domain-containing protein [Myxococcota bacterium]MDW8361394.1 HD domain-containing protein [Myxococcales bacterium]